MQYRRQLSLTIFVTLFATGISLAQHKVDTTQQVVDGRTNSPAQQEKPYVLLISADGFRYDYTQKYNAQNLRRLSSKGVTAASMLPSFPSLTFPNHYTIATGLYPAHHGIVNNGFFDPAKNRRYSLGNRIESLDSSWYGGEPLWVLAEKQQMLAASFYWVGSEVAVQGIRPTYWYNYNELIPIDKRIAVVKEWLELPAGKRPHFITFYFPEVDHEGHVFGPDTREVEQAVHFVDSAIGQMQAMIDASGLPVNVIFVSDHGMSAVDTVNTLQLPAVDSTKWTISPGDLLIHLYAKEPSVIQSTYEQLKAQAKDYDVYLTTQTPAHWHYSKKDDRYNRIGDIIIVPHYPKIFTWGKRRIFPGRHGYDPKAVKEMHATFMAWGPQIREGKSIPTFENVHVYALVTRLLSLRNDESNDSNPKVWKKVMR